MECPYCHEINADSFEYEEDTGNRECEYCGKEFFYERDATPYYSCSALDNTE